MTPTIRFAILAAVSSKPQAAEDKISLPQQIKLCRHDGLSRGWHESAGPFEIPGHTRTRYINLRDAEQNIPALKLMLDAASQQQFDVLILYHYNRLRELLDPIDRTLQAYGVQLTAHTAWTEPQPPATYDPLSDVGKTIRFAQGFASTAEITEFRRRYKLGMPARILKGLHKGAIPYGYRKPPGHEYDRKAVLIPNPIHAANVIRIKDLFLSGKSLWQIANTLNAEHIPAPRSPAWTDVKVRVILKNNFYSGQVHFGKTRTLTDPRTALTKKIYNSPEAITTAKGLHTPLWDAKTQQRINAEFKKRGRKYVGIRTQRLSHILYCASCGARVWVQYPGGYYTDTGRGWACSKNPKHITIKDSILLPRVVAELRNSIQHAQHAPIPNLIPDPTLPRAAISDITARLQRIHEAYESGAMPLPEYTTRKAALTTLLHDEQTKLEEHHTARDQHAARLATLGGFAGILEKLPAYIAQADPQQVNTQLRSIIHKIIISPTAVKIELIQ